jgi:UDP-N-acetyl-D-glucosamine dehydrogenase
VGFVDCHIPGIRRPDGTVLEAVADPAAFDAELVILHTRHEAEDLRWIRGDQAVLDTTYRETGIRQRILL